MFEILSSILKETFLCSSLKQGIEKNLQRRGEVVVNLKVRSTIRNK